MFIKKKLSLALKRYDYAKRGLSDLYLLSLFMPLLQLPLGLVSNSNTTRRKKQMSWQYTKYDCFCQRLHAKLNRFPGHNTHRDNR